MNRVPFILEHTETRLAHMNIELNPLHISVASLEALAFKYISME